MSEPTGTPPSQPPSPPPTEPPSQPPPPVEPAKKKTSPWVWVAVGCLGLLILIPLSQAQGRTVLMWTNIARLGPLVAALAIMGAPAGAAPQ